jgi:hypothetical protein
MTNLPSANALKPRGTIPTNTALPAAHGIYQIEIAAPGSSKPCLYIGETTNLRGRMTEYGEMVRALIGLHQGYRVVLDPNAYRYIHFKIADAILTTKAVSVRYVADARYEDTSSRKREELLALSDIVNAYHAADSFSKILNCMGRLTSIRQSSLTTQWQTVQTLLP